MAGEGQPPQIQLTPERELVQTEENIAAFESRFGRRLAAAANTRVEFGRFRGTVAEMVLDPACPVGGQLETTYVTSADDGVEAQINGLQMAGLKIEGDTSGKKKLLPPRR